MPSFLRDQMNTFQNQFVIAGESLKQLYSVLLEDVLSFGCLDARDPTSPRKAEEITNLPPCEILYITPLPTEPASKAYEDYSSKVAVVKKPEIETSESTSTNSFQWNQLEPVNVSTLESQKNQ